MKLVVFNQLSCASCCPLLLLFYFYYPLPISTGIHTQLFLKENVFRMHLHNWGNTLWFQNHQHITLTAHMVYSRNMLIFQVLSLWQILNHRNCHVEVYQDC